MMEISVISTNQNTSNEKINLDNDLFSAHFNSQLVHQLAASYMSNGRVFSKGWKNRAKVSGSNKKPWAQKGTGRARAGTKKSPLWRSGGVTFAYEARNFSKKVNRKMYQKGILCILSQLIRDGNLLVIEGLELSSHKTKDLVALLNQLKIQNVLIVVERLNENLFLASRNLYHVDVVESIDPVSLMSYDNILFEKEAFKKIELQLKNERK